MILDLGVRLIGNWNECGVGLVFIINGDEFGGVVFRGGGYI